VLSYYTRKHVRMSAELTMRFWWRPLGPARLGCANPKCARGQQEDSQPKLLKTGQYAHEYFTGAFLMAGAVFRLAALN